MLDATVYRAGAYGGYGEAENIFLLDLGYLALLKLRVMHMY